MKSRILKLTCLVTIFYGEASVAEAVDITANTIEFYKTANTERGKGIKEYTDKIEENYKKVRQAEIDAKIEKQRKFDQAVRDAGLDINH